MAGMVEGQVEGGRRSAAGESPPHCDSILVVKMTRLTQGFDHEEESAGVKVSFEMYPEGNFKRRHKAILFHCSSLKIASHIARRRAAGNRFVPVTTAEKAVKILIDHNFTVWNSVRIQPVSVAAFWQAFDDAVLSDPQPEGDRPLRTPGSASESRSSQSSSGYASGLALAGAASAGETSGGGD
uniref:Uncharacterized protein n=1 Tax=Chromera velia CCMP2878 TaxID=1169474 RepID=A0A0G4H0W7_9ALVE|eukprot:Cvel_24250.t1-p1 / transcript=Cvel_24250.t1 / gene=Cvel_24250 / organism=Chromera_velia_CCMP2878 / gene_product=hypothetical protein / transcript_product=hypothetical protein / location=Cvel_scaffold2597:24080-25067(-) / protein_length=182 / sequence_SO=supercontig / SO=protein_coding / is_pseudo=false